MGLNFHAENQENPWSGFREKLRTNQPNYGSDLMGPGDMVACPKYKNDGFIIKTVTTHIHIHFLEKWSIAKDSI